MAEARPLTREQDYHKRLLRQKEQSGGQLTYGERRALAAYNYYDAALVPGAFLSEGRELPDVSNPPDEKMLSSGAPRFRLNMPEEAMLPSGRPQFQFNIPEEPMLPSGQERYTLNMPEEEMLPRGAPPLENTPDEQMLPSGAEQYQMNMPEEAMLPSGEQQDLGPGTAFGYGVARAHPAFFDWMYNAGEGMENMMPVLANPEASGWQKAGAVAGGILDPANFVPGLGLLTEARRQSGLPDADLAGATDRLVDEVFDVDPAARARAQENHWIAGLTGEVAGGMIAPTGTSLASGARLPAATGPALVAGLEAVSAVGDTLPANIARSVDNIAPGYTQVLDEVPRAVMPEITTPLPTKTTSIPAGTQTQGTGIPEIVTARPDELGLFKATEVEMPKTANLDNIGPIRESMPIENTFKSHTTNIPQKIDPKEMIAEVSKDFPITSTFRQFDIPAEGAVQGTGIPQVSSLPVETTFRSTSIPAASRGQASPPVSVESMPVSNTFRTTSIPAESSVVRSTPPVMSEKMPIESTFRQHSIPADPRAPADPRVSVDRFEPPKTVEAVKAAPKNPAVSNARSALEQMMVKPSQLQTLKNRLNAETSLNVLKSLQADVKAIINGSQGALKNTAIEINDIINRSQLRIRTQNPTSLQGPGPVDQTVYPTWLENYIRNLGPSRSADEIRNLDPNIANPPGSTRQSRSGMRREDKEKLRKKNQKKSGPRIEFTPKSWAARNPRMAKVLGHIGAALEGSRGTRAAAMSAKNLFDPPQQVQASRYVGTNPPDLGPSIENAKIKNVPAGRYGGAGDMVSHAKKANAVRADYQTWKLGGEPDLNWIDPNSSAIEGMARDGKNVQIKLTNKGSLYTHANVPNSVWNKWMKADSKGRFWVENIKGKYDLLDDSGNKVGRVIASIKPSEKDLINTPEYIRAANKGPKALTEYLKSLGIERTGK